MISSRVWNVLGAGAICALWACGSDTTAPGGALTDQQGELDPDILQLHSSQYRNPSQLRPGSVLVVGAGNSGAEIAVELARAGRKTWLSGRDTGYVPFRPSGRVGQAGMNWVVLRLIFHRLLTLGTPIGRRRQAGALTRGGPLIRVQPRDLVQAGVERVARTVGVSRGSPMTHDGDRLDVTNVVWCTGFQPGFSWVDLPVFGDDGQPLHYRGIVTTEPGIYFVGLKFLWAMSSSMIHGVDRDAAHVAETIARRVGSRHIPAGTPALSSAWW